MAAPTSLRPPFTRESALQKVHIAEQTWNTRDPDRVALAYAQNSKWRNRDEFFQGRDAIRAFLKRKWARELDYRLKKTLWAYTGNHISVHFEYEWREAETGHWFRTYGNEQWEFDDDGLMRVRDASANDVRIEKQARHIFPG